MTITRRNVLLGATATAAMLPIAARAQTSEVVIGLTYPFSGANAQIGVDAQKAYETAAEIINKNYDFDLLLAKGEGLSGLGGAKVRLVFADHQSDPQKGRAETERLITQEKVCAIIGTYQSAVAVTVSQICERYQIPFISADNSSPSLHRRGLKFYFRAAPHDEMFSGAMFDFFDAMKKKGTKIETLSLFHEDTIFGTDSGNAQLKLALPFSRGAAAQGRQCRRADAVELHHRRYPAGQNHGRTRLQAQRHCRAGRRLLGKSTVRRGRRQARRRDLARQLLARSRRQAADGRQDQRHVQGKVGQGPQRLLVAAVHGPDRDGGCDQSRQVHRRRQDPASAGCHRYAGRDHHHAVEARQVR